MTTDETENDSSAQETDPEPQGWQPSRRRLLEATAATGVLGGIGSLAMGSQQETYRFGGEVSGWMGEEPAEIADETNPTLELQAGTQYEVVWENLDGAAHDFTIRDDQGNNLASTETMSEQGATRTLTFTATQEMTTYVCTVHPNTMVGDIEVTGEATATPTATPGEETPTEAEGETPAVGAGFFETGTEVGVQTVADGPLTAPTDFTTAAGDENRYFVTDQTGEVYVVDENGVSEEPFVDVSDRMVELGTFHGTYSSPDQEYDERGLLGIAFHPNFQENRKFYLHYSAPPTEELISISWDHIEVVSEFQASDDMQSADPESERILLEIPSPQYNHDAGPIAFGPDGYLYVPMGDGGGANDDMYGHVPDWYDRNDGGNGQDLVHNMMGDILRIDVDRGTGQDGTATPAETETPTETGTPAEETDGEQEDRPYGIPEDNPFAGGETAAKGEIWAYGFRNPFGISFDSDGNCFVADAGQNLWEEANVVEKGGNYGWNVKEGTHCFSTEQPSNVDAITDCPETEPDEAPYDGSGLIDPVVEYPHVYQGTPVGVVIVGGHRYEADAIADLQDKYVFGEYNQPAGNQPNGRLLAATVPENPGQADETETPAEGETETTAEAETETGTPTEDETPEGDETEAGGDDQAGTATPGKDPVETETAAEGETQTPEKPEIGPDDIPRDDLWEMEELQVQGEFNYYVRQFGRDQNGELYVLVSEQGVPQGETGAVLRLVPPEEGETPAADETETPTEEA